MSLPSRNSDPARIVANTRTFFVTSATFGRRSLFQSNHACQLFLKVLFSYADQCKYRTHEFVLMKDHFHLLLSVEAGMTVEKAVQLLKGGFAYRASRELGFRSPVWQRGFSELRVRDAESYAAYRKYIQENPVRAGFVNKIEEYPFSSAAPGYELAHPPRWLKPLSSAHSVSTAEAVPDTNCQSRTIEAPQSGRLKPNTLRI